MALPDELSNKRRRSWYVTLVLSAVYTVLVYPVVNVLSFSAIIFYPAFLLVFEIEKRLGLSGEDRLLLFATLNFPLCLIMIRIFYGVKEIVRRWFTKRLQIAQTRLADPDFVFTVREEGND